MAMMAKMRSLAPAFIVTVGALFVLFMVISDSNVLEALGGRSNNVGSVNGDEISYTEFNQILERQRENQKNQTGRDIDEEQLGQFRDQVWDAIVSQKLIEQQIEKFGITVTEQEVRDVILGNNPPEFLKQNFVDSVGNFNRSLYEQALFDPRNKAALVQAEEFVRQQKLQEKLQSLLTASITISESDLKRKFVDQNISINAQFALVDISQIPNDDIKVTDEEIKDYYNNHQDKYKLEAQRKIKYVLFRQAASAEDTASVKRMLEQIAYNYKRDTASFKSTVEMYSALQYMRDSLSPSALSSEVLEVLSKASKGTVVGPIATPMGMSLYNLIDVVPSNETYVKASHILINNQGTDEKNLEEANKVYSQLIAGASFEKLAKEKSGSPEGQTKGGDLGWFGKGMMVPEFEKAAMEGQVGVIQKPVKTNYGYHIIKTTGKSSSKYVVEWVTSPLKASASTVDLIANRASDFAYLANKNGFESEAKLGGLDVAETPFFTEDAAIVPGLGQNKRLNEFVFNNSVNSVAEQPFRLPAGYIVPKISEIKNEGVRPFDEVKGEVKNEVIIEKKFKKAEQIMANVKKQVNGNLSAAPGVSKFAQFNETGNFVPGSTVPSVGRDFAFIEKALKTPVNKVSEPFKGLRGYYILMVTDRTKFDSTAYGIQRNMLRTNLLQEKKSTYFAQWVNELKKQADIEDNRHIFFGQ